MKTRKVGIFLFDDVEVLDFAGPFEVFSVSEELSENSVFQVYTLADKKQVLAKNGLRVEVDSLRKEAPTPDILILPGGDGTKALLENTELMDWVKKSFQTVEYLLSICSGARLLATAGLLKGKRCTTHHQVMEDLKRIEPNCEVLKLRFVDESGSAQDNEAKILTSAGISAGIDLCLYMIAKLLGNSQAIQTAQYMEYPLPKEIQNPS